MWPSKAKRSHISQRMKREENMKRKIAPLSVQRQSTLMDPSSFVINSEKKVKRKEKSYRRKLTATVCVFPEVRKATNVSKRERRRP